MRAMLAFATYRDKPREFTRAIDWPVLPLIGDTVAIEPASYGEPTTLQVRARQFTANGGVLIILGYLGERGITDARISQIAGNGGWKEEERP